MKQLRLPFLPESCKKEALLLSIRPHWIEVAPTISLLSLIMLTLLSMSAFLLLGILHLLHFFLLSVVLVCLIAAPIICLSIARWFFHGYVLTNGKILEYYCLPWLLHITNGILLNQVRCTEIDISKNGLLQHLLDIGDITITFDRPTKQEEFVLSHVLHPDEIGLKISEILDVRPAPNGVPLWTRSLLKKQELIFNEEFAPQRSLYV